MVNMRAFAFIFGFYCSVHCVVSAIHFQFLKRKGRSETTQVGDELGGEQQKKLYKSDSQIHK